MIEKLITLKVSETKELNALLYDGGDQGSIFVAPAMATPARFYARFANYFAERGFKVLLMDYSGVDSNDHLLNATLEKWIGEDIKVALDYLYELNPKLIYVGHSVGGQVLGLLPNSNKIHRSVFASVSTGTWWKHKKLPMVLKSFFFLNIFIPLSLKIFGNANAEIIRMGVNIPYEVAKEWALWCRSSNYLGDHKKKYPSYHCDELEMRILNVLSSDDPIATSGSNQALKDLYPKAKFKDYILYSKKNLGHHGIFKSGQSEESWPKILEWITIENQ